MIKRILYSFLAFLLLVPLFVTPAFAVIGTAPANAPVLASGMTSVNWNTGTSTWDAVNPAQWTYDYSASAKKWANATTPDGSMFVWIPRFTYKINGDSSIDIKFSNGVIDDTTSGYLKHSAFTFGIKELTGVWVAKFEASDRGGTNAGKIQAKPAVSSYRNLIASDMFDKSRNFSSEQGLGGNADSHLMKNSEWGAAAYLAQASGYTPALNASSGYYTGGSSSAATVWGANATQSTTGNIYGVYDMNGGAWEIVSSYNNGGDSTNGLSILTAEAKYKDVIGNSYNTNPASWTTLGMAIEETSTAGSGNASWNSDWSVYPNPTNRLAMRGGLFNNISNGSGIYAFQNTNGTSDATRSFRPSIAVIPGPNAPVLAPGMAALNWNGVTSAWETTNIYTWDYDYNSSVKKWANAETMDGSMFVWIPRYTYKINGTNDIKIRYSVGTTDDTSDGYLAPGAFTFGSKQLLGIWVGKFEASDRGGADAGKIQVKPAVTSYRNLNAGSMFDKSLSFTLEQGLGASADSHLMKNSEWGAVAYLAQASGYTPALNASSGYYTGGSSSAATVWGANATQSTTGNIYGVYDMNGGAWEIVSSYNNGGDSTNGLSIVNAEAKYKDVIGNSYNTNPASWTTLGMAIEETSTAGSGNASWNSDWSVYPNTTYRLPMRGGVFTNLSDGSGIYAFQRTDGAAASTTGFRPVLSVDERWWDYYTPNMADTQNHGPEITTVKPGATRMTAQGKKGIWFIDFQKDLNTYYPANEGYAQSVGAKREYYLDTSEVGGQLVFTDKATDAILYSIYNFDSYTGNGTDVNAKWLDVNNFMYNVNLSENGSKLPTAIDRGVPAFTHPDGSAVTSGTFYNSATTTNLFGNKVPTYTGDYAFSDTVATNSGLSALFNTSLPGVLGQAGGPGTNWTTSWFYRNEKANTQYANYMAKEVEHSIELNRPDLLHFDDFGGDLHNNINNMGEWTIKNWRDYMIAHFTDAEMVAMGIPSGTINTFDLNNYFLTRPYSGATNSRLYLDNPGWLSDKLYRTFQLSKIEATQNFYGIIHNAVKDHSKSILGKEIPMSGNLIPVFPGAELLKGNLDYPNHEFKMYDSYGYYNNPVGYTNPRVGWVTRLGAKTSTTGYSTVHGYVDASHTGGFYTTLHKVMLSGQ